MAKQENNFKSKHKFERGNPLTKTKTMKYLHIRITEEQHKGLRVLCAEENISIQSLIHDMIEAFFEDRSLKTGVK